MTAQATPQAYFEKIYADVEDPWGFASSRYERRKYELTVASLPRPRYLRAFEPGCSIGVLTGMLAERCNEVLACDLLPDVAMRARRRNARHDNVKIAARSILDWPEGAFDLVVLSEVIYYLDPRGVEHVLRSLERSLVTAGHVVAVHYRGETDYPLTGDEANETLARVPFLAKIGGYVEEKFRLDLFERIPS